MRFIIYTLLIPQIRRVFFMNIEAKNLSKIYGDGENRVVALNRANLEIVSSDFISIMGTIWKRKKYPASFAFRLG